MGKVKNIKGKNISSIFRSPVHAFRILKITPFPTRYIQFPVSSSPHSRPLSSRHLVVLSLPLLVSPFPSRSLLHSPLSLPPPCIGNRILDWSFWALSSACGSLWAGVHSVLFSTNEFSRGLQWFSVKKRKKKVDGLESTPLHVRLR